MSEGCRRDQRAGGVGGEAGGVHEADDPAMRAGGDLGKDDRDHRSDQPHLEHPDQPERCHRPGGTEQELQPRRANGDPEKGSMPPLKDRKPAQIVRPQHRCDPVGKDDEPCRPHCFRLSDPEPRENFRQHARQEGDLNRGGETEQPAGGKSTARMSGL